MAKKENKGGLLTNEQVEQEVNRTNSDSEKTHTYRGSQDTGDSVVPAYGTETQRSEGLPEDADNDGQQNP